jgi:hypothetical protein
MSGRNKTSLVGPWQSGQTAKAYSSVMAKISAANPANVAVIFLTVLWLAPRFR